jgi:hypothetical protein
MAETLRTGNPEDLHNIGKGDDKGKKSVDSFVNPGTPENPLVGMDDRKTGQISGTATDKLRKQIVPKG